MTQQLTSTILMIRPANFGYNPETALSNAFQSDVGAENTKDIRAMAIAEFDSMVELLRAQGIQIVVWQDDGKLLKPDAVFPNNWFTTHADGKIITYPMFAENRRIERDENMIEFLKNEFNVSRRVSLEQYEAENKFLEGTGSLLLDRVNKVVYACVSPRTDPDLVQMFCDELNCTAVLINALDQNGQEIYHTNVLMALGDRFVVICMDAVVDETQKSILYKAFEDSKREVVEISHAQMNAFAGNMLQVVSEDGNPFIVMSSTAYDALDSGQIQTLSSFAELLVPEISTIETYGGGSVRCMMAELFLPKKS